jgi:predicted DNA-binding protein with PD1-like motif
LSWTASAQTITNPLPAATLRANDDVIATDSVPSVYSFNASFKDYIIVRLKYKTDILQALNQVVEEHKIKNAVIINGIGSVYEYHVHSVDNATFPSRNIFNKEAKPSDITCLNGFIIEGRVHAHIGLSDSKTAVGGHLEPGTSVFTFCIITIGILDDSISLNRLDDKTWR